MRVLVKSNEVIYLSWIKHILNENEVKFILFDEFINSIEGNITAFPMRILVSDEDFNKAKSLIQEF